MIRQIKDSRYLSLGTGMLFIICVAVVPSALDLGCAPGGGIA